MVDHAYNEWTCNMMSGHSEPSGDHVSAAGVPPDAGLGAAGALVPPAVLGWMPPAEAPPLAREPFGPLARRRAAAGARR